MIEPLVRAALAEDLGRGGDVTAALVASGARLKARFVARKAGIVSGLQPARLAFAALDPEIVFRRIKSDGDAAAAGEAFAEVEGPAGAVLTGERTALNFLTMMSGCATLTRAFVEEAAKGGPAKIAATRKTLPGLRIVQKAAVTHGGGWPHRFGLDDAILVKDNHIAAAGSVSAALSAAKALAGHMRVIEVEIDRLGQLDEALAHAPNAILLDNFPLADLEAAVARAKGRAVLEASGGVSLATVAAIAATGVDVISVGALTHSAAALDIGLDAI
jgi:nicotinate-nucleotide pyrophosphorylase (carboxylating)